jgi:hypothetical protein
VGLTTPASKTNIVSNIQRVSLFKIISDLLTNFSLQHW